MLTLLTLPDDADNFRTKYGGIDTYLLKTKSDLLGWEGMRLRIMVRERISSRQRQADSPAQASS